MTSSQSWLMASVTAYMVAMLGIGFWTSRKIHDTQDYILAGKRLGWWLSIGTISFFVAIYFQNIYTLCTQSWGILLVGVAAPLIFGVFRKRTNTVGALAGAIVGTVSWIVLALILSDDYPTHLFGFAISCVTLAVVTLLTSSSPRKTFRQVGN